MTKDTKRVKFIDKCKAKLVEMKTAHLNSLKTLSGDLVKDASGDVADQARELQQETMALARREKIRTELNEIEQALDRIKQNTYGVCEETGNQIEEKRLESIPWTKLSLEGAEIREMERKEQEEAG